jgi:hypothetical protein
MKHQDSRVQKLLIACPAVEPLLDLNEEPNYVLSQLGAALRDRRLGSVDEAAVYQVLNALANDDLETQNLLVVNVLEILGDTPEAVAVARGQLSGNALLLFERVIRGWSKNRS